VRLASDEYQTLAAAAMNDPSLKGHVVTDGDTLPALWQMADVVGQPPALPSGMLAAVVFARQVRSTCRSVDDVVGVEIRKDGVVVVELDPDGSFLQPCPGPPGARAWTAFMVAIPDTYNELGLTGATARIATSDATESQAASGHDCEADARKPEPTGMWTRLAPPPVEGEEGGALASVPFEGVFFATEAETANVALLNPATGQWSCVEPAPVQGKVPVKAAAAPDTLLLWNGDYAASYDADAQSWRRSGTPPGQGRALAALVVEDRLLVWWQTRGGVDATTGAAWNWRTNEWTSLPPAPVALNDATAVWSGRQAYLIGSWLDGRNKARAEHAVAVAYDPQRDSWEMLPPTQLSPQASSAAWVSGKLLAWDYELNAREYDEASNGWRDLPPLPLSDGECQPHSAVVGRALFASYCRQAAVWDADTSKWSQVTVPAEIGQVVAADGVIVTVTLHGDTYRAKTWVFGP
jgi:hypothetical protein